jgi:hypothetical protein
MALAPHKSSEPHPYSSCSIRGHRPSYVYYLIIYFQHFADSLRSLALFFCVQCFVFIILQTLLQKTRGVGTLGGPSYAANQGLPANPALPLRPAAPMSRLFKVFVVASPMCYALPAKTLRHQARKLLLSAEVLSRTGP